MPAAKRTNLTLRNLPSIDELLRTVTAREIAAAAGERHAAALARQSVDTLRRELSAGSGTIGSKEELVGMSETLLENEWRAEQNAGTRRVINATGVIVHTNLGRAPLSDAARRAITDAVGYCTLEYDIATGKRGRRGARAEKLLEELTGADRVLIVNNCAAAAFFVLTDFAEGGEVIISRGELVEIGGDFRVPDVLSQSRAILREVGTTNRSKLSDYAKAINEKTRLLLRVHPSNYRIVGFTATPSIAELAALAHKHGILFYEDIGSGALIDLAPSGLADEPVVSASLTAGADIVTFSGDKLLGGPQAGIIAGKSEFIDRLRKHPLYRALRVDKLAYAALEATVEAYRRDQAASEVPVQRMLSITAVQIAERTLCFMGNLAKRVGKRSDLKFEISEGESAVGGGAAPSAHLATKLIALSHQTINAPRLELALRQADPPVIARIVNDRVVIDLRTVAETEEAELLAVIADLV
jgi:L-seryl-tRNA(Ser) seleniumtransferase